MLGGSGAGQRGRLPNTRIKSMNPTRLAVAALLSFAMASVAHADTPHTVKCPPASSVIITGGMDVRVGKWTFSKPRRPNNEPSPTTMRASSFRDAGIHDSRFKCNYNSDAYKYAFVTAKFRYRHCTPGSGFSVSSSGTWCNKSSPSACQAICVY